MFEEVILPIIIVVLILGIVIGIPALIISKSRKKAKAKRAMREEGIILKDAFPHVTGLPLADGVKVTIVVRADKVEFEGSGTQLNLERDRITDVSLKTETEIQTHVTSSVGGAVAGGVLFGTLGAIIGGRSKVKKTTEVSQYLIFTYTKDASVEYIAFDVTTSWSAGKFPKEFQNIEKKQLSL